MRDISNLPKNNKSYNGNTRKYGITINGMDYIVKFPKDDSMSVYSEYLAGNFIRSLEIPCQEVHLAVCNGVVVNVIKDFTSGSDMSLHSFRDTKQGREDTEGKDIEYTYDDVIYLIDRHLKMSDANKLEAKRQFWRMFLCDAIIGNGDRHWGNWGYLETDKGYIAAPIYDNGAGLCPGVNKVIDQYIDARTRKEFLYDRVYTSPTSLFKIKKQDKMKKQNKMERQAKIERQAELKKQAKIERQDKLKRQAKIERQDKAYRSSYADMFQDLRINKIFAEQTAIFKRRISYEYVFNSMMNICKSVDLPKGHRRFYVEMVTMRYMCIIQRIDFNKAYDIVEDMIE